jgi:hypothetical protein
VGPLVCNTPITLWHCRDIHGGSTGALCSSLSASARTLIRRGLGIVARTLSGDLGIGARALSCGLVNGARTLSCGLWTGTRVMPYLFARTT